MPRRLLLILALVLTIVLGLASRAVWIPNPALIRAYAGDTLWALAVYWSFSFVWAKKSPAIIAAWSLLTAYAVEFSQLYHAPWIDRIRHTKLGGLLLGFTFLWSDLLCYTVGVALGVALDRTLRRIK